MGYNNNNNNNNNNINNNNNFTNLVLKGKMTIMPSCALHMRETN